VAGDGRLADALAGPDDRQRRQGERGVAGRLKLKVRPLVADARGESSARQPKTTRRVQHGLVGEVDHDLRLREPVLERGQERDAVLLAAAQLLGASGQPGAHDLVGQPGDRVADDGRVVLPVDDHESSLHRRDVTSPSILAVYFSNSSVSTANWMILSCPWKGYFRHTSTCVPENSITL
jgi:hypothetical protein